MAIYRPYIRDIGNQKIDTIPMVPPDFDSKERIEIIVRNSWVDIEQGSARNPTDNSSSVGRDGTIDLGTQDVVEEFNTYNIEEDNTQAFLRDPTGKGLNQEGHSHTEAIDAFIERYCEEKDLDAQPIDTAFKADAELAPHKQGGLSRSYVCFGREGVRFLKVITHPHKDLAENEMRAQKDVSSRVSVSPRIEFVDKADIEGITHYLMSTEWVEGQNLRDYATAHRDSKEVMANLMLRVANAINEIHNTTGRKGTGYVHRDLKPTNIYVTKKGEIKVLDFGLAAEEEFDENPSSDKGSGTPAYMSPDHCHNAKNKRMDIYSAGCIFYEFITGDTPLDQYERKIKDSGSDPGKSYLDLLRDSHLAILSNNGPVGIAPEDAELAFKSSDPELNNIITKCLMSCEKGKGYSSCDELVGDLKRYVRKTNPGFKRAEYNSAQPAA